MPVRLHNRRRESRGMDYPAGKIALRPGGACRVVDASPSGAQIEAPFRMLPNSACVIHWMGSNGTRRAAGRIRWAALVRVSAESAPIYRGGLEFLDGRIAGWVATTR